MPYIQLFFLLKEHPQWVDQCKGVAQTLTMVYKNTPREGDNAKVPPITPKKATPLFHPREMRRVTTQPPRLPCLLTWQLLAATLSNQFPGGGAATWKESMSPLD
jgi:hypothetical protein